MKKIYLFFSLFICFSLSSQITLDHSTPYYGGSFSPGGTLVKLHTSGYKYLVTPTVSTGNLINIYNLNHTLFKSITIPPAYVGANGYYFISENLFDLDSGVEYLVWRYTTSPSYTTNISVIDETGAVLFSKDSASLGGFIYGQGSNPAIFANQDAIIFDGISTKMRLPIWWQYSATGYKRSDIYNLPGSIPCGACTSGTLSGFNSLPGSEPAQAEFFPNPAAEQLKLKYQIPEGYHLAEMKIYDTQGRLVDEFKITDNYDFIYLPTNYNNGLYLYSLTVDGKVVKTEKIVLNK